MTLDDKQQKANFRGCLSRSSSISSTRSLLDDIESFENIDISFDKRDDIELFKNLNIESFDKRVQPILEGYKMTQFQVDDNECTRVCAPSSSEPNQDLCTDSMAEFHRFWCEASEKQKMAKKPLVERKPPRGKKLSILKANRKYRKCIPTNVEYTPEGEHPSDLDVVGGRGNVSNGHKGNRRYWAKILEYRKRYKASYLGRNAPEKNMIAEYIVSYIEKTNGKFLEKEKASGRFYVVPRQIVIEKVKQVLRGKYVPLWARKENPLKAVYAAKV